MINYILINYKNIIIRLDYIYFIYKKVKYIFKNKNKIIFFCLKLLL